MSILRVPVAKAFVPLLAPARYKGIHGGRGSAKSHFFAEQAVVRATAKKGFRFVGIREVQKSLKESVKRLIEDKLEMHGLSASHTASTSLSSGYGKFRVLNDRIVTPGDGVMLFQGMQDHTAESIKSLEGFDVAEFEEAQTATARSLELLRPTIRSPGSELWFPWNPRNASDPIDQLLRGPDPPPNSVVIRANYEDNPWFPDELEEERLYDQRTNPHRYGHIWLGEYEPAAIGAIWDRNTIREGRRDAAPELTRVVVAIDPAVSSEAGSDEHGIVVAGMDAQQHGYVLDDVSLKGTPERWAKRAIAAYDTYEADAIVVEINQGGDMVKHTLKTIRPNLKVIEVRATRGKHVRAEPISALYSLGRVSHVGTFPELENQMCLMTAEGYEGEGSPDRVDALVWAFTELFAKMTRRPDKRGTQRPSMANNRYNPHRRHARA